MLRRLGLALLNHLEPTVRCACVVNILPAIWTGDIYVSGKHYDRLQGVRFLFKTQ